MNDQNFNQESYTPPIVEPISIFPRAPRVDLRAAFGSGLFLALCILMSVITVMGSISIDLASGSFSFSYAVNIFALLIAIGMWVVYSSAKNPDAPIKKGGFSLVSGTIKAMRIIFWICAVLIAICGAIYLALSILVPADVWQEISASLQSMFAQAGIDQALADALGHDFVDIYATIDWTSILPAVVLGFGILCLFLAVIVVILTVTYYKKLYQFAKSLGVCAENPDALPRAARAVSIWLLVMGILTILSGLGGITMILGHIFVNKYFVNIER